MLLFGDMFTWSFKIIFTTCILQYSHCQNKPTTNSQYENITILPEIFRYKLPLPTNLITDIEDGDLNGLTATLKQDDGTQIPNDSWIQLVSRSNQYHIDFFTPRKVITTVPAKGLAYILHAEDADGHSATLQYTFKFPTIRTVPLYVVQLKLASTSSAVFASNDLNVLFYIQENKLLPYSIQNNQGVSNANDWVTESLKIDRNSNGQVSITLEYSAKVFVTTTCNIDNIISMRSKIVGNAEADYKKKFESEFTVQGITEQFNGACQYLSADPPQLGPGSFNMFAIQTGKYFTYDLPSNFFTAPTSGSAMKLTVALLTSDGQPLSSDSWIQLMSTPNGLQFQGYIPYVLAAQTTSFKYQIAARTILLESKSHPLQVSVTGFEKIVENYIVTFTADSLLQIQYTSFVSAFQTVMAQHLSTTTADIFIYSYNVTSGRTVIGWTLKQFTGSNVNILSISKVSSELFKSSGVLNTKLTQELSNIGFTIYSIDIIVGDDLQKPRVVNPIQSYMSLGTFFEYQVPTDAFADATDGYLLQLEFIPDGSPFDAANWLSVNKTSRNIIYGIPIMSAIQKNKPYLFKIRITNSLGNFVDDDFALQLTDDVPSYSYIYSATITYNDAASDIASVLWMFFDKLLMYYGDTNRTRLIVTETITVPATKSITIDFFNSSFRVTPCDTIAIINANKKMFYSRDPNPDLVKIMEPDIVINDITTKELDSCALNNPPWINTKTLTDLGPHSIQWGQLYNLTISADFFRDEEDVYLEDVSLKKIGSNAELPISSWISYDKETSSVYVVPMSASFQEVLPQGVVKYILRATDSGSKSVAGEYILQLAGEVNPFYQVFMNINLFGIAELPYTQQLFKIITQLEIIFGATFKNKICIQTYDVSLETNSDGSALLKWTHCDLPRDRCDFKYINAIRQNIYISGSNRINNKLAVKFDSFQVVGVSDLGYGVCGLTAPDITYQVPIQTITFCGLHTYQIPSNTFTDREDGNTRNLSLSLTKENGMPLEEWMEFDPDTQTISMLLEKSMDNFLLSRQQRFTLTATDKSQLSRSQFLTVNVEGNADTVDYKKILRFDKSTTFMNSGKKTFVEIARKVGKYFQDGGKSFEAIQSSTATDGTHVYEFGNCVINSSPCDAIAMQQYRTQIAQPSFLSIFPPELIVKTSSEIFSGPCSTDEPPVLINQWNPLQVDINRQYTFQVPVNTFQDKEQGFTRSLDLELYDLFGKTPDKNFWIQFDKLSQTLTVVASKDIANNLQSSTVQLKLYAYDIKRQFAMMTFTIKINYPADEFSHYITMRLTVTGKPTEQESFTYIYTTLRQRITNHFGDSTPGIIAYTTITNIFTTTLEIRWSNTTISATKCENEKINYVIGRIFSSGVTVEQSFLTELTQSFNVIGVYFSYSGICVDERTPPAVVNPIPPLKTTYCSSITYLIPSNTITDRIDGDTRNLQLSLSYQNGTAINKDHFVTFDSENQEILVTPVSKEFRSTTFPLTFILKATTVRGLYVTTQIKVTVEGVPPKYSFSVQMTAQWAQSTYFSKALQFLQSTTSSYLGYQASNVHIINAVRQPSGLNVFTVQLAFCPLTYDPCDEANIAVVSSKLKKNNNGVNSEFTTVLDPTIQVLSLDTVKTGPCSEGDKPPSVVKQIPEVTLELCAAFKYKMDPNTFIDNEDGNDLPFVLTSLNNQPINEENTWIYGTSSKEIIATVNNNVVALTTYGVNVRAYDTKQQSVDTTWRVQISGRSRKIFYTYKLTLTPNVQVNKKYEDKYKIASLVNTFYGGNVTNIQSLEYLAGGATIVFTFSSCSLPEYCDQTGGRNILTQLQSQAFRNALQSQYTVNTVELQPNAVCQGPLNPPTPSRVYWDLEIRVCGELQAVVPENMFTDTEDGNTRALTLKFSSSRHNVVLPDWIQFDSGSQTVYAMPTYDEAVAFQDEKDTSTFTLTATDKSGLSSDIITRFTIILPQQAKYKFQFQYRGSLPIGVQDRIAFARGVADYFKSSSSTFGYYSYSSVAGTQDTTRRVTFANCSITYTPSCDLAALKEIKNTMVDDNNFPNQAFQQSMSPSFNLLFGTTLLEAPCTDTFNPPRVTNPIPEITITICGGYKEYMVPIDTFYDPQDGVDLQLSLKTVQGASLTTQSWVQLDSRTRLISMYPLVLPFNSQIVSSKYTYSLTATDTSNLGASTPAIINIAGPTDLFQECKIKIQFQTTSQSNRIERLKYLNTRLRNYFNLNEQEAIAMVQYLEMSSTQFILYFSYCSPTYTDSTITVDYHNFVNSILIKLFQSDRQNIVQSFYSAFGSSYTIENVQTEFTGRCGNIPPVVPVSVPPISLTISSCGYTQKTIPNNQFYDFEDGLSPALNLKLYGNNGVEVNTESWINFDKQTLSLIAVCNDQVRNSIAIKYRYTLKATDANGASKVTDVTIEKLADTGLSIAPFDVTFEMQYLGVSTRPMVYQAMYLAQRIKSYYRMTNSPSVYIKSFTETPGFPSYKKITWTSCTSTLCNVDGILDRTKTVYNQRETTLKSEFVNAFLPQFDVKRVFYMSSKCSPPTDPPYIQKPIPKLKLEYCSIFTYNIPGDTYFDKVNGETNKMKISLLDSTGNLVSSSSVMQLNRATLQLFSVNIESQQQTTNQLNYKLAATNSLKLTTTSSFSVELQSTPYIVNCPVTMEFTYNYLTSMSTDVDVLIKIINTITQFYKDQRVLMKVIDFKRYNNNVFMIKWTNCTFQYQTSQLAANGLLESQRSELTTIFTKIINTNTNTPQTTFVNTVSSIGVQLVSLSVNYNCIETPPRPASDQEQREYARYCQRFMKVLPNNLFIDDRDGDIRSMTLQLTYTDGTPVSIHEWVQLNTDDKNSQYLYGTVTQNVENQANNRIYKYQIKCTDSSGRTANKSISVTILQTTQTTFTNIITLGFTTQLSTKLPTAYILSELTERLAKYLDPSDTGVSIHVHSFNRQSVIQFSYCKLICSTNSFNDLFNKMQLVKYKTEPSIGLVEVLKDEFNTNYIFIDSSQCQPTTTTIIVNKCSPIKISACGMFSHKLSRNCFSGTGGADTRSFLLSMTQTNGTALSQSTWLNLDVPSQTIFGTVILDQVKATQSYNIQAKHSTSDFKATNEIEVDIEGFNDITSFLNDVCRITMQFADDVNYPKHNVEILQNLVTVIAGYSNNPTSSIVVNQFHRQSNVISITYTNCTWIEFLKQGISISNYLQNVNQILESYFRITQTSVVGITAGLQEHFTENGYSFLNVISSNGCTQPPNPPPVRNRDLDIELTVKCGVFASQVPEDTFIDRKYGNTRRLVLELLSEDGQSSVSWISVNTNQELYGMIDKTVSESMPTNGYKFVLKATNPVGQSSRTSVTVRFPKKIWTTEMFEMMFRSIPAQTESSALPYKVSLSKKLQSFDGFKDFSGAFYVKTMTTIPTLFNIVKIGYCQQCNGPNYLVLKGMQSKTRKTKLIEWLSPSFNIQGDINIDLPPEELLNKECTGIPYAPSSPNEKEVKFCQRNVWNMADTYTELVENYHVLLVTTNDIALPKSSWINLLSNPYRVVSFPTETQWKNQQSANYQYKVVMKNKKTGETVGTPTIFTFKVIGTPQTDGLSYTMRLTTTALTARQTDVYIINELWSLLDTYMGSEANLQHVSLVKADTLLTYTWFNCSLPSNCVGDDVTEVQGRFLETEAIKSGFLPKYLVADISEKCSDNPPVVRPEYNITIPLCGCFAQQLPDNFAVDAKDGDKIIIELLKEDGVTQLPRSSWIIYNANTKIIEALPEDSIINAYDKTKGYVFMFKVSDTKGKYSYSKLTVRFAGGPVGSYSTYTLAFRSRYPTTTPYVEIKKNLMKNFASEMNSVDGAFQVVSFSLVDEQLQEFVIKLKNCLIGQYTCPDEYQQLKATESNLEGSGKSRFIQRISLLTAGSISVSNIIVSVVTTKDKSPIPAKPIDDIKVTYCNHGAFDIPDGTFRDIETTEFVYELHYENGVKVPYTNWVYVVGKTIFVSPTNAITPGTYTYKLIAFDGCKLQAERKFKVELSGDVTNSPYSLVMQFQLKALPKSYAEAIWSVRSRTETCRKNLQGTADAKLISGLRSEEFIYYPNGYIRYQWSDCSIKTNPCVQTDLEKLSASIFASPNTVSNTFKQCFQPECELQQVTELKTGECKPPNRPPSVKLHPKFNTTFCRTVDFSIDPNTFVDDSSNRNARQMKLDLLTENFSALPVDEWIQFDSFRQRIYGYPRTGEVGSNVKTIYKYKLRATDLSTGASASTDVDIQLLEVPSVNYVMIVEGTKSSTIDPNIKEEIQLIDILKRSMNEERLNDVTSDINGNDVVFKWSFCHTEDTCNCQKIQQYERSKAKIKAALAEIMTVTKLTSQKYGNCDEGPVQGKTIPRDDPIPVGQCYNIELPSNIYYDRQDKSNIELFLRQEDGSQLPKDHWLQLEQDKSRLCGLLPYNKYLQNRASYPRDVYRYQIGARDSCSNQIVNKTQSIVDSTTYTSIEFMLVGTIRENTGEFLSNCTKIDLFINKIANYSGVNKTEVLVKDVQAFNETIDNTTTQVTWGYRVVNCSNVTVHRLYNKFFVEQNQPNPEFEKYMEPEYEIVTLRNQTGGDCFAPPVTGARVDPEGNFPWWIVWCVLAMALLILLCWLLWLCCPRCCPGIGDSDFAWSCCGGLCGKCCTRTGTYSSFKEGNLEDLDGKNDIEEGAFADPDSPDGQVLSQPFNPDDPKDPYVLSQPHGPDPYGQVLSQPYDPDGPLPEDPASMIAPTSISPLPQIRKTSPSDSGLEDYPDTAPLAMGNAAPGQPTSDSLAAPSSSALAQRRVSEAVMSEQFVRGEEEEPMQMDFSDDGGSFKTEAYTEQRAQNGTVVSALASQAAAARSVTTDTTDEITVESYKDRRLSVIKIRDDDNRSFATTVQSLPQPLILPMKTLSKSNSRSRREYFYADALVDSPIVFKTRRMPKVRVERQRRMSDGDGDVILKKVKRVKSRSKSPSRRQLKSITNVPLNVRLEERKQSRSSRNEAKLVRNEAKFVYKEPSANSAYRQDEFITFKAPAASSSRSIRKLSSKHNLGYMVDDDHFESGHRRMSRVKKISIRDDAGYRGGDDFDDIRRISTDRKRSIGRQSEGRRTAIQSIRMEDSTTDSGVYDEIVLKPTTSTTRLTTTSSHARRYKTPTTTSSNNNNMSAVNRRHKSSDVINSYDISDDGGDGRFGSRHGSGEIMFRDARSKGRRTDGGDGMTRQYHKKFRTTTTYDDSYV